jgi:hypothetical protein
VDGKHTFISMVETHVAMRVKTYAKHCPPTTLQDIGIDELRLLFCVTLNHRYKKEWVKEEDTKMRAGRMNRGYN